MLASRIKGALTNRPHDFRLLSRNEQQIEFDISKGATRPRQALVVHGGQPETDKGPVNLFHAFDDEEIWQSRSPIVVGASVTEGSHPIMADALIAALQRKIGNLGGIRKQSESGSLAASPVSKAAEWLGSWIIAQADKARFAEGDGTPLSIEELQYFVASSGWRAFALAKTLDTIIPNRHLAEIVDIGGGPGVISWLFAAAQERQPTQVTIVDPNPRYQKAAFELWSYFDQLRGKNAFRIVSETAGNYRANAEVDLFLMCQTLYNIDISARQRLLERCWESLKPGGLLVINEVVLDDDASDAEAVRRAYRQSPRRGELIRLLSQFGEPKLYRGFSNWSRPENPLALPAREYGSDNFLVIGKLSP